MNDNLVNQSGAMYDSVLSAGRRTPRQAVTDWIRRGLFSDDREGQVKAERVMSYLDQTPVGAGLFAADVIAEEGARGAPLAVAIAGLPPPIRNKIRALRGSLPKSAASPVRTPTQSMNLRDLTPEQALAAAKKEPHIKRRGSERQIVGAPRGMEEREHIDAMRSNFDNLVAGGATKGDWYTRAADWISRVTGRNPAKSDRLSQELALTSAQADPGTNLGFTLQGHNAIATTGKAPPVVRTGAQAREMESSAREGRNIKLGAKTGIYESHMNPRGRGRSVGTNDIWHARALGYKGKGGKEFSRALTAQEHAFMDHETVLAAGRANERNLGGRSNWTAGEVQAAPWVRLKAEGLMKKYPKRFRTIEEAMEEAGKTYPDYAGRYTVNATHEAVPGRGTGHLEGRLERDRERRLITRRRRKEEPTMSMVDAPRGTREAYSSDRRSSWEDKEGRDILYSAGDFYVEPTRKATGFFKPRGGGVEVNPARVARPLMATSTDKFGKTIHPRDQAALSAVEGVRAYADVQNMGAWHKLFPDTKVSAQGAIHIPLDRQLSRAEMIQLNRIVEKHGLGISDTGRGVTLMDFSDDASGKKAAEMLKGGLGADIASVLGQGVKGQRTRMVSDAVDYEGAWQQGEGSGAATRILQGKLTDERIPLLVQRLDADPAVRQKMRDLISRDAEWSQRTGLAVRQDVQRARSIIAERGFAGLFEALKRGEKLPAITAAAGSLPALMQLLSGDLSGRQPGQGQRPGAPQPRPAVRG
jgi:hypothetical protein